MVKEYFIQAALYQEINSGAAWTNDKYSSRLVEIKNLSNKKSIVVTHRSIDSNFIKKYTEGNTNKLQNNPLILEEYYRNILEIKTDKSITLSIKQVSWWNLYDNFRYLLKHPNDSIRLSTWLGIILTTIGLIPPLYSFICWLFSTKEPPNS